MPKMMPNVKKLGQSKDRLIPIGTCPQQNANSSKGQGVKNDIIECEATEFGKKIIPICNSSKREIYNLEEINCEKVMKDKETITK